MRFISRAFKALFHPAHSGLGAILVLLTLACLAIAVAYRVALPAFLALAPLGGIVVVVRATLAKMAVFDADALRSTRRAWAMSADDADEARARMAGASGPAVNIDGMPMVAGAGVDIFGRVYGDDDRSSYDFDRFADDAVTGMALDTTDAWSSPTGMHPD